MGDCHTAILHITCFRDNIESLFFFAFVWQEKNKGTDYLFIVCELYLLLPNFFESKYFRESLFFQLRMVWQREHALLVRNLDSCPNSPLLDFGLLIFKRGRLFLHNTEIPSCFNMLWFFDRFIFSLFSWWFWNAILVTVDLSQFTIPEFSISHSAHLKMYLNWSRWHPYTIYFLQLSQWNFSARVVSGSQGS